MHPKNISISEFDYSLPDDRIPEFPLEKRDHSRLLIYEDGNIRQDVFLGLAGHLPADSLLVFNKTRVVPARIIFTKKTGGQIELFCLEPDERYADVSSAMNVTSKVFWKCLVGGASKWKRGQVLEKTVADNGEFTLFANYVSRHDDYFIIEFSWTPGHLSFAEILQHAGAIPLPPYIKRNAVKSDDDRYQTVYAEKQGSVAAPTAGLHFTGNIFSSLKEKGIATNFVTLHVGAGTFKPVKSEQLGEHSMHSEWFEVTRDCVESLLENIDKKIVAVGTTSLRTIESLYWLGKKLIKNNDPSIDISQWEPYEENEKKISSREALNAILKWMGDNNTDHIISKTSIIIAPGYQLRIAKGLITNFHQPRSTLLLLVAAIIGDDWKMVYDFALKNDFRFLSYGDGSLLWSK